MSSEGSPLYALRDSRISKENLYMVLALWMERFHVEQEENEPYKKVGAVLVLPNDMSYAVDCSRNGVHGVARLLMAHQDILQDCKVFVSRKPCSLCTKLLVQSKIKRVFYLPVEPEYYVDKKTDEDEDSEKDRVAKFETETSCVDELFKVSPIAQSVFVPKAGEDVVTNAERRKKTLKNEKKKIEEELENMKAKKNIDEEQKKLEEKKNIEEELKNLEETEKNIVPEEKKLFETYWKDGWMDTAREKLPWPAFDTKMKDQVKKDFKDVTKWMAGIVIGSGAKKYDFKAVPTDSEPTDSEPINLQSIGLDRQEASDFITLAKFLTERTDDPVTGVGAVIINKDKDVLGLGWNGFPTKALYGEFPRAAADGAKDQRDNIKYPYIIHAEQNALLMRNTKNIADATIFVTKTPCDECTPLLEMQGIKTFVLGVDKMQEGEKAGIGYKKFATKVRAGHITCFVMKKGAAESSGESSTNQ